MYKACTHVHLKYAAIQQASQQLALKTQAERFLFPSDASFQRGPLNEAVCASVSSRCTARHTSFFPLIKFNYAIGAAISGRIA